MGTDDLLRDVRDTANVVMEFKEQLAARLRVGGPPPSESWWRRYDEAKRRWVELDADVTARMKDPTDDRHDGQEG